jgi:hypothetical protein
LEGDEPSAGPEATGPGAKYALGPTPPQAAPEPAGPELPEAYGTGTLALTARDSRCLYAHWDLTREQRQRYHAQAAGQHLILRVFEETGSGRALATEIQVDAESQHWFIHVPRAAASYVADVGHYLPGGAWVGIAASGVAVTPPDTLAEDRTVQLGILQAAPAAGGWEVPPVPLAEPPRPALEAQGGEEPEHGSEEGQRTRTRPGWEGASLSSGALAGLARRELEQEREVASQAAAGLGQAAPAVPLASVTSPGGESAQAPGPVSGAAVEAGGFWLNVNAEVVIYGATEPGARVAMDERPVRLRPDGSFSCRFALPDGNYELDVVAVSGQGDRRAARFKFGRATEHTGEVGVHPPDPSLEAPPGSKARPE